MEIAYTHSVVFLPACNSSRPRETDCNQFAASSGRSASIEATVPDPMAGWALVTPTLTSTNDSLSLLQHCRASGCSKHPRTVGIFSTSQGEVRNLLKLVVFHHVLSLLVVPGLRLEQCVASGLRCFVLMLFDVVLACFAVLCWVALCFILLTMLLCLACAGFD